MTIYIVHKGQVIHDQTADPMYAAMLMLEAGRGYRIKKQVI